MPRDADLVLPFLNFLTFPTFVLFCDSLLLVFTTPPPFPKRILVFFAACSDAAEVVDFVVKVFFLAVNVFFFAPELVPKFAP